VKARFVLAGAAARGAARDEVAVTFVVTRPVDQTPVTNGLSQKELGRR
jgi:hypothetical protein